MCKSWFGTKKADGRLCRVFPVTTQDERKQFSFMYKREAQHKLTDSHLWLSVFLRPSPSNFTRAQRLTCCMALLFLSMVTSAMFYKTEDNVERPMQLELGPFSFSAQELFVSAITVLICLPPSLLIVQIFRHTNKQQLANLISPDYDPNHDELDKDTNSHYDQHADLQRTMSHINRKRPLNIFALRQTRRIEAQKDIEETTKDQETKIRELPQFVLYIGWIVALLAILVPGFFVILYSMEWGAEKANAWFSAYLLSFFESTFISDPGKVMIIALFATIILYRARQNEKEYDTSGDDTMKAEEDMTPEELEKVKKMALMESRARGALKELILHCLFTAFVICITYSATDSQSHYVYTSHSNTITDSFYKKVEDYDTFFMWLTDYFVPNYFVLEDVNGKQLHWRERKFMSDRASFRIGPARMRQLRVPVGPCIVNDLLNATCYGEYDLSSEDTAPFGPEAIRNDTDGYTYLTNKAWFHTPSWQVMGEPFMGEIATYGGGGYLAKLDVNRQISIDIITELKDNLWLDRQTRAVLLEFSTYNPNIQLFSFITIGLEIPYTGGVLHYTSIQILRAYSMGFLTVFSYFCLLFVLIYSIGSLVVEIKDLIKQRYQYFKSAKNWITIISLTGALALIIMFVVRMVTMSAVLAKMNENHNEYVQFRRVALYDEVYKALVALLATACILKVILLLRLNKRVGELVGVLHASAMPLGSFVVVAFTMLMAFTTLMHYWYRTTIYEMRTPSNTMASLVSIALGDFESKNFTEVSPIVTGFVFSMYMVVMNVLLLNILTTILMESQVSFHEAKQFHSDEHLLGEMMLKKLFGGLQKTVHLSNKTAGI